MSAEQDKLPLLTEPLHPSMLVKASRLRLGLTPSQAARWFLDLEGPEADAMGEFLWLNMEASRATVPSELYVRLAQAEEFKADFESRVIEHLEAWTERSRAPFIWVSYASHEEYVVSPEDRPEHWPIVETVIARLQDRYPCLFLVPFDRRDYDAWRGRGVDTKEARMSWCLDRVSRLLEAQQSVQPTLPQVAETIH